MARQENGISPVIEALEAGPDGGWRKAVLSLPAKGTPWTKVTAEPVALAGGAAIKVVASEGGRQRTWTVALERWPGYLKGLLAAHPTHINVVGNTRDWHAREAKSGRWLVSRGKPSLAAASDALAPHDRPSYHPLPDDDPAVRQLFIETGLYSLNGKLRGEAADKYRQVQHYLELLRPLEVLTPPGGPTPKPLRIVDAGCGKAYLSLALQLFARRLGFRPELVGVDRDAEVIAAVEGIAQRLELEDVRFEARSIVQYAEPAGDIDLLVSLHACDTATDEALAAGIRLSARAIVLVPCCHHELVEQIEERLKAGETLAGGSWDAVTGAGLLRHRLADIITDALRAAALEAHGYKTSVIEFISPEATARNLMLRAEKRADSAATEKAKARGLDEYRGLRDTCGVSPSLERLLDGWPGE